MNWLRGLRESFYIHVVIWAAAKIWPIMDLYCPDGENVKAIIFCDDDHTLNKILRGYTNPDAER